MTMRTQSDSEAFRIVVQGVLELHGLEMAGRDESTDAERVRDSLDAPLAAVSNAEKERARWLSEDLYSISEPIPESAPRAANPQVQQSLAEAIGARHKGQWDEALTLLRGMKDTVPPGLLSYLRGSIWRELGQPDVAACFYEHASTCEPTNDYYRALSIREMDEASSTAIAS